MGFVNIILLSTALGADLFSVAIGIGMRRAGWRRIIFASIVFAAFHIVMFLAGYHFGHILFHFMEGLQTRNAVLGYVVHNWAHVLGGLVLIMLGLNMIRSFWFEPAAIATPQSPLRGVNLMILAVSVSIDALAAGFGMGVIGTELVLLCATLGAVIFIIAITGLGLGNKLGLLFGHKAELFGGLLLTVLGIHVFM